MFKQLALLFSSIFVFWVGCNQKQLVNSVTWTGSSHTIADTIVTESDSIIIKESIYLAHRITITDTGSTIITRSGYDAPREVYQLIIPDSIQSKIFSLLADSAVKSFKPNEHRQEDGITYCGFNYLLEVNTTNMQYYFNYLPSNTNPSLTHLQEIFEGILKSPSLGNIITKDTVSLDKLIFEKVKGFNPSPPLRSTINFRPPDILALP